MTATCTGRRRWWANTTKTNKTRHIAVGTTKKSAATRSVAWFVRNVRQVWEGAALVLRVLRPISNAPGPRQDAPIPRASSRPHSVGSWKCPRSVDSTIDTNDARPDLSLNRATRSSAQIGVGLRTSVTMDHPDGRATPCRAARQPMLFLT